MAAISKIILFIVFNFLNSGDRVPRPLCSGEFRFCPYDGQAWQMLQLLLSDGNGESEEFGVEVKSDDFSVGIGVVVEFFFVRVEASLRPKRVTLLMVRSSRWSLISLSPVFSRRISSNGSNSVSVSARRGSSAGGIAAFARVTGGEAVSVSFS